MNTSYPRRCGPMRNSAWSDGFETWVTRAPHCLWRSRVKTHSEPRRSMIPSALAHDSDDVRGTRSPASAPTSPRPLDAQVGRGPGEVDVSAHQTSQNRASGSGSPSGQLTLALSIRYGGSFFTSRGPRIIGTMRL